MKVFLGNGPWDKPGFYGVRAGSRWPHFEAEGNDYMPFPFFLSYCAAVLEQAGHEVLCVDAIAEKITLQEFLQRITDFQPDLAILEISTISLENDLAQCQIIREIIRPEAKLGVVGLHVHISDGDFLESNPRIDFSIAGEYELAVRDLAGALQGKESLDDISGLSYRKLSGQIAMTPQHAFIKDIDSLPWPARHHFPMLDYHDEPGSIPRPSVQMWASRGCPYGCIFCAWPQIMYGNRKYRARHYLDVVDEWEWLIRECHYRSVYFDDDTFNIGPQRMHDICREVVMRKLHHFPWAMMARFDLMNEDLLDNFARAGLHAVKYGVETASQDILHGIDKQLDLTKLRKVISHTRDLGIQYHLTFMFGLPGETYESAMKTIDLALDLDPVSLQFTLATPFPGSRFHSYLQEKGMLTNHDYSCYDGFRSAVVKTEHLSSDQLEEIVREANSRWHEHLKRRIPTRAITEPLPLVSLVIPCRNSLKYIQTCLNSVRALHYQNVEVIVVDDSSSDGSADFIEQNFPEITVERLYRNKGPAAAVNHGVSVAKGDIIATINTDTTVDPGWLNEIVRAFLESRNINIIAPKILCANGSNTLDSAGTGMLKNGYTFQIGQGVVDRGQYNQPLEVFGFSLAAAAFRRDVFRDVGNFDEDYFYYLEDVDWCFRAQIRGYRCIYIPTAVAFHKGGGTFGKRNHPEVVRLIGQNTVLTLLKNYPKPVLLKALPSILGQLSFQTFYHLLRSRAALPYLNGLARGFRNTQQTMGKHKFILGHRRVNDERILQLFEQSGKKLREFKRPFWKRLWPQRPADDPLSPL